MLHLSEKIIQSSVYEDIRYISYVMRRGQFISEKSKENHLKDPKAFKQTQNSSRSKKVWLHHPQHLTTKLSRSQSNALLYVERC